MGAAGRGTGVPAPLRCAAHSRPARLPAIPATASAFIPWRVPSQGVESVGHRGLSDRAVIVGYVDGMKRAVSGKAHLHDDGEGNEGGPDPKCAVQLSSLIGVLRRLDRAYPEP